MKDNDPHLPKQQHIGSSKPKSNKSTDPSLQFAVFSPPSPFDADLVRVLRKRKKKKKGGDIFSFCSPIKSIVKGRPCACLESY